MNLKIIFMGTPEFAVGIVDALNREHDIVLVVTQPDTYNQKKKEIVYSPVKLWAIENNKEVFQPEKIRLDYQKVIEKEADLIVTAAYGQIVGEEVLNHPKYRCINVHGSILPKYRGGAPIQRAIMNGEVETGISIMYMEKKMDAGDILRIEKVLIADNDNQATIFTKLSQLASSIINDVVSDLQKGLLIPMKQNEEEVTFAWNITKEDELIDFNKTAIEVYNQIRGLNPNPGSYFLLENVCIKVYNSIVSTRKHQTKVGVIVGINKDSFDISCQDNTIISILEVQLPSKNKMSARDFINGQGRKMLTINKEIK